jgi:hypothetical protein
MNDEKTKGLIASNEASLLAKLEEAAKLASPRRQVDRIARS